MSTTGTTTQFNNHSFFRLILDAIREDEPFLFDQLPDLILSNALDHLSFEEMLKMACTHPAFVNKMLELITPKEPETELGARIKQYKALPFLKEMDSSTMLKIAKVCLPVAQKLINDPGLRQAVGIYDFQLFELGLAHLPIALEMIQRGKITEDYQWSKGEKLDETRHLMHLGIAHPEIASMMMQEQTLSLAQVTRFANHPFVIDMFVKDKTLLNQLTDSLQFPVSRQLMTIGVQSLEIAEHILANQDLLDKLSSRDLERLGRAHKSIAEKFIDNEALLTEYRYLELAYMAAPHLELAERLLSNERLFDRMLNGGHGLLTLGIGHLSIAKRILMDAHLRKHLEKHYSNYLVYFANEHPEIAQHLLSSQAMRSQLSVENLKIFAVTDVRLARQILDDNNLSDKLSVNVLHDIAESHPSLLERNPEKFQQAHKPLLMWRPTMMRLAEEIKEEKRARTAPSV